VADVLSCLAPAIDDIILQDVLDASALIYVAVWHLFKYNKAQYHLLFIKSNKLIKAII